MFRWVEMSLEFLKGVRHRQDFMKHLDRLPPKLSQLYDAVYTQINEDTENARSLATDTLKWLLYAQRLLSKVALIAAVYNVVSGTIMDLYEGESQLLISAENDILRCCRNFVILDSERDVFRLAHQSVHEFLITKSEFTPEEQHTLATIRCIDLYLTGPSMLEASMKATRKEETMRYYARWYWPVHYQRVVNYDSHELDQKIIQFFGQEKLPTLAYREWIQDIKSVILEADPDPTNLAKVPRSHKTHHRENLFFAISVPETHLTAVCAYGYSKYLKDHAVFPMDWNRDQVQPHDAYSKSNDSFLAIAAQEGHTKVVEILLDRGANILSQEHPYQYDTLLAASRNGNLEVVKLLLDRGVETYKREYTPWQHQIVLQAAIETTEMTLVERLLNSGADEYRGIIESRALSWALEAGLPQRENVTNIIKLLLDRGTIFRRVALYPRANGYLDALQAVIAGGNEELVGHVLDQGDQGRRYRDALQETLSGNRFLFYSAKPVPKERVIKMLLDRGTDLHPKGGGYGSSLQAAIVRG